MTTASYSNFHQLGFIARNYWRLRTLPLAIAGFCFLLFQIAYRLAGPNYREVVMAWGICFTVLGCVIGFLFCRRYYRRRFGQASPRWTGVDARFSSTIGILGSAAWFSFYIRARLFAALFFAAAGLTFMIWEFRKDPLWNHIAFGFVYVATALVWCLTPGAGWHISRFFLLSLLWMALIALGLIDHWRLLQSFPAAQSEHLSVGKEVG